MISVILWVLAALLALLVAVLSLPLRVRVHAGTTPHRRIQVHTTALGGLAPAICLFDSDRRKARKKKRKKKRRRSGARKTSRSLKLVWGAPSLIAGLIGNFRIVQFSAEGEFGFDDPADTGVVCGLLAPLVHGIPPASRISVDLRPVFGQPCFCGRLDATVEVTPVMLAPPVIRFAWRNFGPLRS